LRETTSANPSTAQEKLVMKKNDRKVKKLQLNRETLGLLRSEELEKADGGLMQAAVGECTGCPSGCGIFEDNQ
jgi:hypothetical protein